MSENNQLVTVRSYDLIHDAEFARMILESHDINCELFNRGIVGADHLLSNAVGGINVKVVSEDAERAIRILKETEEENSRNYKPWCPNCDSENVIKKETSTLLKILSVLTFGVYSVLFAQSYKCNDCGHKWS